jgi:MFS family permease
MLPETKSFLFFRTRVSLLQLIRANPHGWVVVVVCFFALSVVSATRASIGLVMPSLEADFGWSRSFVSSVAAWALVTMAVTAPIVGNLLDRYGARIILTVGLFVAGLGLCSSAIIASQWQFLLSFALLAGIGYGTVAKSIVSATIVLYFEQNRGLATGFASAGSTAGQLALLPTLAFVLTAMGWRYGYIFLGISCFVFIPFVWFLIGDAKKQPKIRDKSTLPAMGLAQRLGFLFRNRTFLLLLGSYTICGFTTAGVIETHLIPYVQSCGIPVVTGASAYGVLAGFNLLGMAVAGWLADKMHRPLLLGTIYGMRGLSFLILMMVPSYDVPALFLFAVMFGLFDYSTIPATTSLIASHVGLRVMGLALGMLGMFHSAGAATGAFLGGVLYDLFQQYTWVWIASVSLALLAAVMAYAIREKPDETAREEAAGAPATA